MELYNCILLALCWIGMVSSELPTMKYTYHFQLTNSQNRSGCCLGSLGTREVLSSQSGPLDWQVQDLVQVTGYVIKGGLLKLEMDYCWTNHLKNRVVSFSWGINGVFFDYNVDLSDNLNCETTIEVFTILYKNRFWDFIHYFNNEGPALNSFLLSTATPDVIILLKNISFVLDLVSLDPLISSAAPVPFLNPWTTGANAMSIQLSVTYFDTTLPYECVIQMSLQGDKYEALGSVTSYSEISSDYWILNCEFQKQATHLVLNYSISYEGNASARPSVGIIVPVATKHAFICERPEIISLSASVVTPTSTLSIHGYGFHPGFFPSTVAPFLGPSKLTYWEPDRGLSNDTTIFLVVPQIPNLIDTTTLCLTVTLNYYDFTDCSSVTQISYKPNSTVPPSPSPPAPSNEDILLQWLKQYWWVALTAFLLFVIALVSVVVCVVLKRKRKRSKEYEIVNEDKEIGLETQSQIKLSDVTIGEMIGSGSFAVVYRGYWRKTEVAIKMLQNNIKNDQNNFLKETSLMLNLRHPNVVTLMGIVSRPKLCIVTEFCSRGDVAAIMLDEEYIVESEHIRKICLDTCRGMTYLHGENVIHRDLKARNLLIDKDWNVKVADFGLARAYNDQPGTMTACGTPTHAAPEVIKHLHYTGKADVYSFGICMWEMCVRKEPYETIPGFQVIVAVATKRMRPKIPATLDSRWSSLIRQCWTEDPELRPPFQELVELFEQMKFPTPLKKMPYKESTKNSFTPSNSPLRKSSTPATPIPPPLLTPINHGKVSGGFKKGEIEIVSLDEDSSQGEQDGNVKSPQNEMDAMELSTPTPSSNSNSGFFGAFFESNGENT